MKGDSSLPQWLRPTHGALLLDLVIQPRASRSRVVGEHDGRLKVQITAPPVDGEANAALLALLSDLLRIPRRDLEIAAGSSGRRKTVRIIGLDSETIQRLLASNAS